MQGIQQLVSTYEISDIFGREKSTLKSANFSLLEGINVDTETQSVQVCQLFIFGVEGKSQQSTLKLIVLKSANFWVEGGKS